MPQFVPIPQSELKRNRLLPKGKYDFEILRAENKTFNSGSQGIALKVGVFNENGGQQWIDDYLVFVDKAIFKVADFCACVGLQDKYEAGELDARDCVGRSGQCRVGIEEQDGYEPKNKITGYIAPKAANAEPQRSQPQSAKVTPTQRPAPAPAPVDDKDTLPF